MCVCVCECEGGEGGVCVWVSARECVVCAHYRLTLKIVQMSHAHLHRIQTHNSTTTELYYTFIVSSSHMPRMLRVL